MPKSKNRKDHKKKLNSYKIRKMQLSNTLKREYYQAVQASQSQSQSNELK